jgi:integrase/recombinase XerC
MDCNNFKNCALKFIEFLSIERNLSPNTLRAYRADLQLFLDFWQRIEREEKAPIKFQQILERYFVSLYNQNVDTSSIARKVSCFRSLAKFTKTTGVELKIKLERPRVSKKLPSYLSVDELFYLLDKVQNEELPTRFPLRDRTIFELLYATGVRCAELVNIKLNDIDTANKTIRIMGKGRRERLALFGSKALNQLKEYLAYERIPAKNVSEHLFLNYQNNPITTRSVQRICAMFKKFLKIKRPLTPHKLRHSFATHLINQGASLRAVQELLGHKTITSTELYTHVAIENVSAMCDKLHPLNTMKPGTTGNEPRKKGD